MSESALVVLVPEADVLVDGWREDLDPSAAAGVPAHITVLYPFLAPDRIDAAVRSELVGIFARHAPVAYTLPRVATFAEVVYLEPEPDEPFRSLTEAVVARWPDHPPYGGEHDEVIPHLTVAQFPDPHRIRAMAAEIATALDDELPLDVRAEQVTLLVERDGRWRPDASFTLGG